MSFIKTTEQSSKYNHLEKMSISELLLNINNEDKIVPIALLHSAIEEIQNRTVNNNGKILISF